MVRGSSDEGGVLARRPGVLHSGPASSLLCPPADTVPRRFDSAGGPFCLGRPRNIPAPHTSGEGPTKWAGGVHITWRADRMAGVNAHGNPRKRNGHRRRQAVARLRARRDPCGICGQPIDYDLPPGNPMAFEADDIVPVSLGGDPCDINNLRASHRICNQRRSNRVSTDIDAPSPTANPLRIANDKTLPLSRAW